MAQKDNGHVISVKGNRLLWIDFVSKVRKEKRKVWDVMEELIKDYLRK